MASDSFGGVIEVRAAGADASSPAKARASRAPKSTTPRSTPDDDAPASDRARAGRKPRLGGPFLKWAGGKTQLLAAIVERLPPIAGTYFEPFIGGGAVFFELARSGRLQPGRKGAARLFDANEELICAYRAVRDEVDAVIASLAQHRNDEAHFYEVRGVDPQSLSSADRAARTIFLNRVGYNGLYRVNASGKFNVPFGRYRNPLICDEEGLRAASKALACAELEVADFETACAHAGAGDVVYLDPPYLPLSRTASFTAYAKGSFGEPEHRRLAATFAGLVDAGAYALLSNSDTPLGRELYAPFKLATVEATRMINSKADKRGVVNELLVMGIRV